MKVTFLSRKEAEGFLSSQPYVMISICDPEQESCTFAMDENRKDVLEVRFHDIDRMYDGYTMMGERDAAQIANFVRKWWDIPLIAVHCHAGISRSSGTAMAIAEACGRGLVGPLARALPNARVRRLVHDAIVGRKFTGDALGAVRTPNPDL